jgi:peptidoglycan/xylan/chitin deacetylase (PgdA/CDA1 family)
MAGTFILSLDCEGKWGVADHLDAGIHAALTDEALLRCYAEIVKALHARSLPATFAVVDFFTRSTQQLQQLARGDVSAMLPYTSAAWADLADGTRQGWSAPWLPDLVAAGHEIASHGASHTPFGALAGPALDLELELIGKDKYRTIIFPRNDVAHVDRLGALGMLGYRARRAGNKISRIADEFNLFERSERRTEADAMTVIPAGFFINWRAGVRRYIPPAVSRMRARRLIDHAIATDGVVHYWTHPENIVTAPETMTNFLAICDEAVRGREQGMSIVTQEQYCVAANV